MENLPIFKEFDSYSKKKIKELKQQAEKVIEYKEEIKTNDDCPNFSDCSNCIYTEINGESVDCSPSSLLASAKTFLSYLENRKKSKESKEKEINKFEESEDETISETITEIFKTSKNNKKIIQKTAIFKAKKESRNDDEINDNDNRFKVETDKSLIYDSKTDKDICMYFDDETRDWLLDLLNTYVE